MSWTYNRPVRFEWDEEKARGNRRKHGVSFEEAKDVFDDPLAAIRIFSARPATRQEQRDYEEGIDIRSV